jgi:hypothetical protein
VVIVPASVAWAAVARGSPPIARTPPVVLVAKYVTVHNLFILKQYLPEGRNASEISGDVETTVREGRA